MSFIAPLKWLFNIYLKKLNHCSRKTKNCRDAYSNLIECNIRGIGCFRPRRLPCETHSRENESACSFVGTTSERSTTAATTNRQYFWERGGINCNTRRDWLELTIVYSYRCYPLISVTITEYLPTVKVFVSTSRRVKERALDEETAIRYYLTCSKVRESASLLPKPVKQDCSRGFHLSVSFTLVLHEKILLSLR